MSAADEFLWALETDEIATREVASTPSLDAFLEAGQALANRRGILLSANELRSRLQEHRLRWRMRHVLPMSGAVRRDAPPADWLPIHCSLFEADPRLLWSRLDLTRWDSPFFVQDVEDALAHPLNLFCQGLTKLSALDPPSDRTSVAGLILHVGRCGSTLLSQMLARQSCFRVLSEPQPISAVLRHRALSLPQRVQAVRQLLEIYAAKAPTERLLVKLDAADVVAWQVLRQAWPDVPFVVLYRQPLEVLASILKATPSAFLLGAPEAIATDTDTGDSNESLAAHVLLKIFDEAVALARSPGCLLLNYTDLPEAVGREVLPHFGGREIRFEPAVLEAASRIHAKDPHRLQPFSPDAARKQASAATWDFAYPRAKLDALYAELEELRRRKASSAS